MSSPANGPILSWASNSLSECKTLYSSQKKVGANAEVLRVPSGVNMQLSSAGLYQGQEKSKRKMEREQNWTEARAGKRAVQVSEGGGVAETAARSYPLF